MDFLHECLKQSVLLALELGLKEKEKELMKEIDLLIQRAKKCDEDQDKEYKEKTGFELPEDLKFKEERLAKIKTAKEALERLEEDLNPGKEIEGKKQVSDHRQSRWL